MNETVAGIIQMMRAAAPPGRPVLDEASARRLRELTRSLIDASPGAAAEHGRFLAIRERGLHLPAARQAELARRLHDATVLVTGGTGCVGSALVARLAALPTGRLVSVSRGMTNGWPRQDSAEYLHADIRDRRELHRIVTAIRPDVIFHVAAQRDPGLAEVEVHRTISTNVLGTRNVLATAEAAGVGQVVHASTGKAQRPYSPDMYTVSKRAAEWIVADVAARGRLLCSAARFTHVVDNSIVYRRLLAWARGDVPGTAMVRLHGPDIAFYAQSALESSQLLLLAYLGGEHGELRVHAITDLGWPVSLLDLALAVLAAAESAVGVYFSGYDAGYEQLPFPGLHDPRTAGDVSPLMNSFEAAAAVPAPGPEIDAFRIEFAPDPRLHKLLSALDGSCDRTRDPVLLRQSLNELSWSLLDATLRAAPRSALARSALLAKAHGSTMSAGHRRVLETISDLAGAP
ncbi:MAG TPA: polysaccharide biosynthesis protein [Trebonia sp.]